MNILIFAMVGILQATPQDLFSMRCDLQGVYDEIAQATLSSRTAKDIDMFHDVFYAPNWVFVDSNGQRHVWNELREQAIGAASQQTFTTMRQMIQEVTPVADGATALVNFITVKTVTDNDGKYGRPGLTHTIAEVTPMRDTWMKTGVTWKLQSRVQLGAPKVFIDKMPPDIENPRCPS